MIREFTGGGCIRSFCIHFIAAGKGFEGRAGTPFSKFEFMSTIYGYDTFLLDSITSKPSTLQRHVRDGSRECYPFLPAQAHRPLPFPTITTICRLLLELNGTYETQSNEGGRELGSLLYTSLQDHSRRHMLILLTVYPKDTLKLEDRTIAISR